MKIECFKKISATTSCLVLDFNRPNESKLLLESIKRHLKVKNEVIFLSNGGEQDYVYEFYKNGLIDKCILNKKNEGSGFGTIRLTEFCQTDYFINLQCDNYFIRDFTEEDYSIIIDSFDKHNLGSVDLTCIVPESQKFSERAFIANTEFYCSNPEKTGAGTGPIKIENGKGTEESFYNWIIKNNKKIFSIRPQLVGDSGKYAILQVGENGILKRRCDTQELKVVSLPNTTMDAYNLSNEEWSDILCGKWEDWRIPEKSIPWVSLFFSDSFENEKNRKYLK